MRITLPGEAHEPIPDAWLDAIDDAIAWRGPDGAGRFRDTVVRDDGTTVEVALVHRRLSIIDHAGGAQPMVSEHGRTRDDGTREGLVAVVFNGCIYNHRALREELEKRGHAFETDHSDTEVLVHGFREWGDKGLKERIDGMAAWVLWSRDEYDAGSVGVACSEEKPLFSLTQTAGNREHTTRAFASTAPAFKPLLRAHFEPGDEVSTRVIPWICLGFSSSWAPERQIRVMRAEPTGVTTADRPVAALEGLLSDAVASRLEADVPLGCLLSGGIDSSLVAHYAQQELGSLTTISVRMDDERYDESRYAEMVAERLGTDHHTIDVHPEPARDLIHLVSSMGLPFGDSSLLPTYWACKAAREHVKVVLSGDGADELFYGYERYEAMRYLRWARLVVPFVNTQRYDRSDPKSRSDKLARFFEAAGGDGYLDLVSIFPRVEREKLFGKDTSYKAEQVWSARRARAWDLGNYLPGDLLRKTDTASMAAGVELRAPFLARELSEHVRGLPRSTLMPGGRRKGLLKHIAYKHLPHEIIGRPKMGFAVPVGEWFRTDFGGMRALMMDTLDRPEPFGPCHGVVDFNMDYVNAMIREHDGRTRDHGQRLYMLTVLGVWADTLK